MSQQFRQFLAEKPHFMRDLTGNEAPFVRLTVPDSTCFPKLYEAFSDTSRTVLGQFSDSWNGTALIPTSCMHWLAERCLRQSRISGFARRPNVTNSGRHPTTNYDPSGFADGKTESITVRSSHPDVFRAAALLFPA
jgi:hypothetical protein